jgi:hypothetical protein
MHPKIGEHCQNRRDNDRKARTETLMRLSAQPLELGSVFIEASKIFISRPLPQ